MKQTLYVLLVVGLFLLVVPGALAPCKACPGSIPPENAAGCNALGCDWTYCGYAYGYRCTPEFSPLTGAVATAGLLGIAFVVRRKLLYKA